MLSSKRTLEWKPLSQPRPVNVPAFGKDTDGLGRWVSQECTCMQVRGPEFGLQYPHEKFGVPIILALGRWRQTDSWSSLASQPIWMVAPARHPTSKENKWNELLRKASDHLCPPDARISATFPWWTTEGEDLPAPYWDLWAEGGCLSEVFKPRQVDGAMKVQLLLHRWATYCTTLA